MQVGRELEQAPDLGGDDMEPRRQRQDRRCAELRHRLQERDQRAGEQRGHHDRQADAAEGVPAPAAEDRRGVLELGRDALQRVRHQHEDIREGIARHDEDQPGHGVDVEQIGVGIEAEEPLIPLVQQAAVGRRQDLPGDGAEEGRGDEGGHHQQADQPVAGHVGARHQPGERRRDHAAGRRHARGDAERRHERRDEGALAGEAGEIRQRQRAVLVGDAIPQQPAQWQQHQSAQDEREQRQHRLREVKAHPARGQREAHAPALIAHCSRPPERALTSRNTPHICA